MPKLPKALTLSEAYHDDPVQATELWTAGFRPMDANELKPGMTVAYRQLDVFHLEAEGLWAFTLVGDVLDEDTGTLTVSTFDRGNVEVDECDEMWAK